MMTEAISVAPPAKPAFSQDLQALAEQLAESSVNFGELLRRTQGRGIDLLLIIAALPFITPVPLPGFSIPFGLVALIVGARTAMGRNPWLPQKLLSREIPPRFFHGLLTASTRVVKRLEYFLRPRLLPLQRYPLVRRLAGVFIALSGLFLILPLPIPFTNGLPALTILLLAAGALERDGLAFLIGSGTFLLTVLFFVFLSLGGVEAIRHLPGCLTN